MSVALDTQLLRRYDRPGPRYTSYPAAPQFSSSFGEPQLRAQAARSAAANRGGPLSLYVHVPFCFSPCFYCGCNRLITRDLGRGGPYVERVLRELALAAPLTGAGREIVQLHLGGGTPNFLGEALLERLLAGIGRALPFSAAAQRDFSIELDPRSVPAGYPAALARLGFNRVSLGVQDFDAEVQRAVNRLQDVAGTRALVDACRESGIRSVNIDLIYGLPRQTPEGFRRTLQAVIAARPDRLAVYGYAHLPALFKAQRRIAASDLPDAEARLALLALAIEELGAAGYRYIGMDHFALPGDELVRAQAAGGLQRNFMGYTTHAGCDLLGVGVSAISHIGDSFSQNFRDLQSWGAAVDSGRLPVWRGLALSADDRLRAAVIGRLMCQGDVDIAAIEREFGVDFAGYFGASLARLAPLAADGLVRLSPAHITATAVGRLLLRSIAMCFDAYLGAAQPGAGAPAYSRAV
jgi:oxygen-independent coproporphyrinogen III oxidase